MLIFHEKQACAERLLFIRYSYYTSNKKGMVRMMIPIQSYVRRGQRFFRKWAVHPQLTPLLQGCGFLLSGFLLSAASLGSLPQPLTLGALCALTGWPAVLFAAGGCCGYWVFWGRAGLQGIAWLCAAAPVALLLNGRRLAKETPLLIPAIAGLIVSAGGVAFQLWMGDQTSIPLYLLRVALGALSARLFSLAAEQRDPIADWLVGGIAVLALAQVSPFPGVSLGYLAAGMLAAGGSFPAVAIAGMALDLACITQTPMTAVLCLAYLACLLPRGPKWLPCAALAGSCCIVMALCGTWELSLIPWLTIGGAIGIFLPPQAPAARRRGETGLLQVRLELASGVLAQTQQLLLEVSETPIDEEALTRKAVCAACAACPCRKSCRDFEPSIPSSLLHRPLLLPSDLPVSCRKTGRLLQELRRCQERLRMLKADRKSRKECRSAVIQQYQFLGAYLQQLSDQLGQRGTGSCQRFQPEIAVYSAGKESANGDRCLWFAGTEYRYYILLCDGMGTGLGAAQESRTAGSMLRRLLSAGFPAEYALRSLNSLCALRSQAGAVTIDLAELQLDTGKATLYKWGAAPSYLLTRCGAEKIGTASPPPGLSVTDGRETVDRLSLRRGETLVLVSDGVDGEDVLRRGAEAPEEPPGELAARILEFGQGEISDDATVAVVRLGSMTTATE